MFGIESFVSNHSGFSGEIKQNCKDFVVHEIDNHGNKVKVDAPYKICTSGNNDSLVESSRDGTLSACSVTEDCTVHEESKVEDSPGELQNPSIGCKVKQLSHQDPHPHPLSNSSLTQCTEQLEETHTGVNQHESVEKQKKIHLLKLKDILGDEQVEKICTFAETEFDLNLSERNASNNEQIANIHDNATFVVGIVSSKDTRAEIHNAIKYLFPHTCTETQKPPDEENGRNIIIHTNSTYWKLSRFVAANELDNLIRFLDAKDGSSTFSLTSSKHKEERTQMHREISKYYGSLVETKTFVSSTGPHQEKVHRIVVRIRQRHGGRGQKRKATQQPSSYTGFVLKKENLEMLDVISKLAGVLRVHPSDFSYAGIKDKKAVTTQLMCVKGITPHRLKSHFSKPDACITGVQIGHIHHLSGPIQRGQLSGNQFDIVIREVKVKQSIEKDLDGVQVIARVEEEIRRAAENVQTNMFINYFGQQRFGATSDIQGNAANIGLELLKGNHVQAVKCLLSPVTGKDDAVNKAKQFFQETHDAKTALSMMPNYKSRECMLLKALHRHGLDHDGCTKALMSIPHSMRQLYVHSYCSLVWNKMATQRIIMYGRQLMEGDLVMPEGTDKALTRIKVHTVTQEDINSKSFAIQDVVLPLPGNSIQYPSNKLGDLYRHHLGQDGLSQSSYRLNSLKINIPGDYRKLLECPTNLTYHVYSGTCFRNQDTCKMETPLPGVDSTMIRATGGTNNESNITGGTSCNPINVRLSFRLPASSYATMCIREMMKE